MNCQGKDSGGSEEEDEDDEDEEDEWTVGRPCVWFEFSSVFRLSELVSVKRFRILQKNRMTYSGDSNF